MHTINLNKWTHKHNFTVLNGTAERRSMQVLIITAITMIVEIIAGFIFGSMALLADGWHMATHVFAFMLMIFTYKYAKKHAQNGDFTFGTGKVSALGGFASAVALATVALMMSVESIERILSPKVIYYNQSNFNNNNWFAC